MKLFDQLFHILTGGLEFLEVSAKLTPDIDMTKFRVSAQIFAKHNNIRIFFVDNLPNILIGKDIYLRHYPEKNILILKALHSYYDGISIAKFFNEIDKVYTGNILDTLFKFKSPIDNILVNKCVEIGANYMMNQEIGKEKYNINKEVAPFMTFTEDIKSGDLIRQVHQRENMDMILLISKTKLESDEHSSSSTDIQNSLTFRYVKKGEDFKHVLKNSGAIEQTIRFAAWLASDKPILFMNNLSSIKLPSYIERLVNLDVDKRPNTKSRLKTLVAYPRLNNGKVEVYLA